jgi:hypothetical protein
MQSSRCNALESHSLAIDSHSCKHKWVRGSPSTPQAWTLSPKGTKLQSRPAKGLFISPSTKRAIVPFHWAQLALTGHAGRYDWTRCTESGYPWLSTCPPLQMMSAGSQQSPATHQWSSATGRVDRTALAPAKHRPDAPMPRTRCYSASVRSSSESY